MKTMAGEGWGGPVSHEHPPDIYIRNRYIIKKCVLKDNYGGHPNQDVGLGDPGLCTPPKWNILLKRSVNSVHMVWAPCKISACVCFSTGS